MAAPSIVPLLSPTEGFEREGQPIYLNTDVGDPLKTPFRPMSTFLPTPRWPKTTAKPTACLGKVGARSPEPPVRGRADAHNRATQSQQKVQQEPLHLHGLRNPKGEERGQRKGRWLMCTIFLFFCVCADFVRLFRLFQLLADQRGGTPRLAYMPDLRGWTTFPPRFSLYTRQQSLVRTPACGCASCHPKPPSTLKQMPTPRVHRHRRPPSSFAVHRT